MTNNKHSKLQRLALKRISELVNESSSTMVTISVQETSGEGGKPSFGSISHTDTLGHKAYALVNEASLWVNALLEE